MPATEAVPDRPVGLRRVTDADAEALIALVGAAYDEHPGCVLDLPGIDDDLPQPGTTAARRGSPWWVVERDGEVVASIGAGHLEDDGRVELKRLYVRRDHRGGGLATALVGVVERQATGLGAGQVELWTDTRFTAAHRRYAALGYAPTGETRHLDDPSDTTEYRYLRTVTPAPPTTTVPWDAEVWGPSSSRVAALPDGWSLLVTPEATEGAPSSLRVEVDDAWRVLRVDLATGVGRGLLTSDGTGRWWRDGEPAPDITDLEEVDATLGGAGGPRGLGRLVATCRSAVLAAS